MFNANQFNAMQMFNFFLTFDISSKSQKLIFPQFCLNTSIFYERILIFLNFFKKISDRLLKNRKMYSKM